jgi:UDP-glucose 4-epimerase
MSESQQRVLVTGAAGYIASHVCLQLLEAGCEVIALDNLVNSSRESLRRVESITGKTLTFIKADLLDKAAVAKVFSEHSPHAVMHFAGLKAVGESVDLPLAYYHNNITGTLNLLQAMSGAGVKKVVFSSSATVYGDPISNPIDESFATGATNPYGRTKLHIEEILTDLYASDAAWDISILRYFNPVGAHHSGSIGEDPSGIPNNLMPYIAQVASGARDKLSIFGDDYATPDGTGVRDYIHVVDLARGHLKALAKLDHKSGYLTYNLGTGVGYSVLDMVKAFEAASGCVIPYEIVGRRAGDIATCYANPHKANTELDWRAEKTLQDMCADAWNWQRQNPEGY